MELRYEVSPSEAGIVVDGLIAQGFEATELNLELGQVRATVLVAGLAEGDAGRVRDAVTSLASDPTPA